MRVMIRYSHFFAYFEEFSHSFLQRNDGTQTYIMIELGVQKNSLKLEL